jgi:hypothetical protein
MHTHFGSNQTVADVSTEIWMYLCRELNRYWQVMQFPIFQRHHLRDSRGTHIGEFPLASPVTPLRTNIGSSLTEMQVTGELWRLTISSPAVNASDRWLCLPLHPTQPLPPTDAYIGLFHGRRKCVSGNQSSKCFLVEDGESPLMCQLSKYFT